MIRSEQAKRDKKIKEALEKGEKVRTIAARFGLYPQRIYQIKNKKEAVDNPNI